MKKYFTLFSVLAMFFVGTQMSNAQERTRTQTPEVIAKTKTHQMHELVNLTGEQQSSIFKLLVDSETNLAALNSSAMNLQSTQSARSEILNATDGRIKTILTREQYEVYMKYRETQSMSRKSKDTKINKAAH